MMRPLWKDIRPADVATLLNVFMGVLAIAFALQGDVALAFHIIFAAVIVDGIDGAVARMGGGGGPLGQIIDTLADVVTFVVAPTALVLAHFGNHPLVVVSAFVFAASGVLRLARFQALHETPHFLGLSTPGGAIVLGSAILLGLEATWLPILVVAIAWLMTSRWPVPKLRGAIGVIGVAIILTNLGLFAWTSFGAVGLLAQLVFTAIYLAAGPVYLKAKGRPSHSHEGS